jgi:hypothetical protein
MLHKFIISIFCKSMPKPTEARMKMEGLNITMTSATNRSQLEINDD